VRAVAVAMADVDGDGQLDLVSANVNDDLSAWSFSRELGTFSSNPVVIGQGSGFLDPSGLVASDFDGDGRVDLVTSNSGTDDYTLFFQRSAGSFNEAGADLLLGNAVDTQGMSAIEMADVDQDGDLDLICSNGDGDSISIFHQFSPALFSTEPAAVLGSPTTTDDPRSLVVRDLDGDGRVDIAVASRGTDNVVVWFQASEGSYPAAPDLVLGGALGDPVCLTVADLNADGDLDLVTADEGGNHLSIFFQTAPRTFATLPSLQVGGPASTSGPSFVIAVDLDGDGDLDLASANSGGDDVAVFLQDPVGFFSAVPDSTMGNSLTTDGPSALAAEDLDGDGDLDLVCSNAVGDDIAVFFQSAPGVFPAAPNTSLSHASLLEPTTLVLADIDLDGDVDIVTGNTASKNLTIFRQDRPGNFIGVPVMLGDALSTDSPRNLIVIDVDGDGDPDLVSAQPTLDRASFFFGSH
jgi:hypothetical protein